MAERLKALLRKILRNPWSLNALVLIAAVVLLAPFFLDLIYAMGLTGVKTEYTGDRIFLVDDAKLLTEEEEAELVRYMGTVAEICPAALLTTDDTGGLSNARYGLEAYDRFFPTEDGVLFLIDMDNRTLRLQKSVDNQVLTTSKCDSIMDNVYRYAARGDYFGCARETFTQVNAVLGGRSIHEPMKHVSNLLIALCLGLMTAFLAARRENDVNRPKEVYQLNRNARRTIELSNGTKHIVTNTDFAAVGAEALGAILEGLFSGDGDSGGGWSGGSSGGGRSSGGGFSSGGSRSSGSRSSGSSHSSGSRSSGGSHRF